MSRATPHSSPWPNGHPLPDGLAGEPLEYIAEELAQGEMEYDAILELLRQVAQRGRLAEEAA